MTTTPTSYTAPNSAPQSDWFLCQVVEWANDYGVELGLTLSVDGQMISGQLIGGETYFAELADHFRGDFGEGTLQANLAELIRTNKRIYEPIPAAQSSTTGEEISDGEAQVSEPVTPQDPAFIHLRDAQIFAPGQPPLPSKGQLWRGRLTEVDGFSMGRIRTGES